MLHVEHQQWASVTGKTSVGRVDVSLVQWHGHAHLRGHHLGYTVLRSRNYS